MSLRSNSSAVLSALIVVATGFLCQNAVAQNTFSGGPDGRDPFVIMRGDTGNQMMASGDYVRGVTEGMSSDERNIYFPAYDQARYYDMTQMLLVPPVPPALGDVLSGAYGGGFLSVSGGGFDRSPWADYERETFYGSYAVLARLNKLSAKETERIAAYRSTRQQLLKEIRTKFEALTGATPAERTAGLAELAAQQDTRLRALAGEEEAIRSDLAWVYSVFGFRIALRGRVFHFDPSVSESPRLFSGAYFYAGLSTEQRLLLTEIAYGQAVGMKIDGQYGKVADSAGFYFLPATSCFPLPANLPPALKAKIDAFAKEKESLKTELRAAVLQEDYFFTSTRTKRLAALAGQQAPRFAALDALAEEIRVGLAGLGFPHQPGNLDLDLPADLTQRLESFNARKVEVRRELLNRLRQFRTEYRTYGFDIKRKGDGLAIMQAGDQPAVDGLADFNASQARQYTAFAAESEILRRDIQRYLESSPQRATRTVDQLAGDFAKAYAARGIRDRYRDYARAVLEPGLSAMQRRLLFQSVIAEMENGGPLQP
jgi:hypothetical protein